jgi:hypothetical protein
MAEENARALPEQRASLSTPWVEDDEKGQDISLAASERYEGAILAPYCRWASHAITEAARDHPIT